MTAMDHESSRRFWDEKARENPYWYVSACGPYGGRDLGEFWDSGPRIWQDLKEALGYQPRPGHTVVEVGCGDGRLTASYAHEAASVVAIDPDAEAIAELVAELPQVDARAIGIDELVVPAESADVVLFAWSL